MNVLLKYRWSGNVRELENTIENAVVMADFDTINLSDLPSYLQSQVQVKKEGSPSFNEILKKSDNLKYKDQLALFEREIIRRALQDSNGNKTHAAKRLGFSKKQLKHSLLVEEIGNTYSASSLISLANSLNNSRSKEHVFYTRTS